MIKHELSLREYLMIAQAVGQGTDYFRILLGKSEGCSVNGVCVVLGVLFFFWLNGFRCPLHQLVSYCYTSRFADVVAWFVRDWNRLVTRFLMSGYKALAS